jgi:hypothetical protein
LKFLEAEFTLGSKGFPAELSIDSAVSLLVDLETARQERSVLLSKEPKTMGEGRKRSLAKNTKLDFMSFKTNSYKA